MEENTNEDNSALGAPLLISRRETMELEQVSVETNADESIWLKILCVLGGVYPTLRENGKCKCNWKTVGWSIVPFVWTVYWIYRISILQLRYMIFAGVWLAIYSLNLFLFLSLSYTRKRFSDAIVGEENRLYINTVAKRGLILSVLGGVIYGVSISVNGGAIGSAISGGATIQGMIYTHLLCLLTVIIIRSLFSQHTSVVQVKTELLEIVRGPEVKKLQTKLLEISKMTQEASVGYLQVPLSVIFVYGVVASVNSGIVLYKQSLSLSPTIFVVLYITALLIPLWLLTRVEKFYLWTLRELLHRNTVMPRTEYNSLLLQYDTIAPRASVFGIYITRGRIASITIPIFGSIASKIGIYLYHNLGNPANLPSGNHTQW